MRALLELNDVNPSSADEWSRTPLSLVIKNGHERIATLLSGPTNLIPKYLASLESAELLSPAQPSEPPSKRTRKSYIQGSQPTLSSLHVRHTLPADERT